MQRCDLPELVDAVRRARSQAFLEGRLFKGAITPKQSMILEDLHVLFEINSRLPYHPGCPIEHPLDRLMYRYFEDFRHTRDLGLALGLKLSPNYAGGPRRVSQWQATLERYWYTPLESELAWLLKRRRSHPRETWKKIVELRNAILASFHEFNHSICYRLLRPIHDGLKDEAFRASVRHYYVLVESLVRVREIELAEAAARISNVSRALKHLNLVGYPLQASQMIDCFPSRPGEQLDFEKFSMILIITYFQRMGTPWAETLKRLESSGCERPDQEFLDFYFYLEPGERLRWYDFYVQNFGYRFLLPPEPKGFAKSILRIKPRSPTELLADTEERRRIYDWYLTVLSV